MSFKLGEVVREIVSGFEGVVTADARYLNGCVHYYVQPPGLNSKGRPRGDKQFGSAKLRSKGEFMSEFDGVDFPEGFPLGVKVCDRISKFEGISYVCVRFADQAVRVGVQASTLYDGRPIGTIYFDAADLDLVETTSDVSATAFGGGPRRYDKA